MSQSFRQYFAFSSLIVSVLIFAAMIAPKAGAAETDVVIDELTVEAFVDVKDGVASRVRMVSNYTLSAGETARTAILTEYYDNDATTIEKASAPGPGPVYASAETSGLFYTGNRVCVLGVDIKARKTARAVIEKTFVKPEFFTLVGPGETYPLRRYVFKLHVPKTLKTEVRVAEHNTGIAGEWDERGGERIYTLELSDIPAWKSESAAPTTTAWWPCVSVNVCFDTVDGLYHYLNRYLADRSEVDATVSAKAVEITRGIEDDMAKIDAIARWVRQNIRYIAIEHGEWGHRPDRAEAVLEKRFGDCKGSANLIRMMLRAVGIDGRLVWIGTRGSSVEPWSVSRSLESGNHQIAAAVLRDTVVFLDGTVKYGPRGYVPYADAGQEVIVENGDAPLVMHIPAADTRVNRLTYTASLAIDGMSLSGRARLDFAGSQHIAVRNSLDAVGAPLRESVLGRIFAIGRKSLKSANFEVNEADETADSTFCIADITDPASVKAVRNGDKLYVALRPLRYHAYGVFKEKTRRAPFDCGTPSDYAAAVTLTIPDGYTPEALPKRLDFNSKWFTGYVEYAPGARESEIVCRAELVTNSTEGSGAELEAWNAAVREIEKASNTPIILTR